MDASTFETVFKDNYKMLCILAFNMLGDESEAKDLVQSLFIDLWEKRDTLEIRKDTSSYLWISVKNRCLTYQRNRASHEKKVAEHEQEERYKAQESQQKNSEEPDITQKLSAAIGDMPPQRSQIFQLVYIQGLQYQQAADKLHISKNSIKTQLKIGLKHLRTKLGHLTWE